LPSHNVIKVFVKGAACPSTEAKKQKKNTMTILDKDKIRLILRILQYVPVAITFFFTLSFWREGDTEGAVAIGAVCIGLMLLNLLLHISHIRNKLMAIRRHLGFVVSVLIISLGVYSLVIGSIYGGYFMC
jgi:hypothetical protein